MSAALRPEIPALRHLDLLVLALALAIFLAAGLPMLGYAVAAGAWLVGRGIQWAADRKVEAALDRGDRRTAMGLTAFSGLGRVWLIALAVLLVGLADRDAGLAAAVLSALLFTVYLVNLLLGRLFGGESQGGTA